MDGTAPTIPVHSIAPIRPLNVIILGSLPTWHPIKQYKWIAM
jgi:hypothetical protein